MTEPKLKNKCKSFQHKPCFICGSNEYLYKFSKNGFKIVTCKVCKLIKTIIPENLNIETIYNKSYFQGGQADGYADYMGSENVLKKEFSNILKKLVKLKKKEQCYLLEIGCAFGYFLELAKQYFICNGIEISEIAAENAKKKCNNIIVGPANDFNLNKARRFDIVVMLDVIEHLPDPSETLESISNNITGGGIILITTGNIGSLLSKITGEYWRLMTPPQHITFFSKRTLKELLLKHGFRIIELSAPFKFVPLGLILYQLERYIKIKFPRSILRKLGRVSFPINLFDTIRVIAVKI